MEIKNTLLDDISAEIGFTATSVICAWYGGRSLYIPKSTKTDNALHRLIGGPAFERLVRAFGDTQIRCVPKNTAYRRHSRRRQVRDLILVGESLTNVCEKTGFTTTHLANLRRELEEIGLLPVILRAPEDAN